MMNKNLLIGLAVLVVIGIGYFLYTQSSQPVSEQPADEITVVENRIVLPLSEQNDSGESGTATLAEVDGQVVVTLDMTGAPADVSQPAHIHTGVCPDVAGVVYPLEFPLNGESTTTLDVTLAELKSQLPLGINVHKSTTEASVYVSCGDVILP